MEGEVGYFLILMLILNTQLNLFIRNVDLEE